MNPDAVSQMGQRLASAEVAINFSWTLLCGFLVMFMQAGFALVETGLVRAKNVAHTMAMNFLVYSVAIIGYWAIGFALQMGGVGALGTLGGDATLASEVTVTVMGQELGLFGWKGFFLSPSVMTSAVAVTFLFQMVFMDTAATIPTGALAERWKLSSFVLFTLIISTVIYPVYGNWVWGGGWLSSLGRSFGLGHGHVDFAGSSVVHMTGGITALVAAKIVGPRRGKFGPRGEINPIPGHNIAMVVLGTFILAFGWFGFNAGSTLAGTDLRIAVIAVNTMLASAGGAVAAFLHTRSKFGLPDISMTCNGMLAGMVAITAPCAFVSAPVSVFIGAAAGVLVIESALFIERTLRIDDPVGASSVHGVCGAWGIVSLGLFANGTYGDGLNGVSGGVRGLFYGDAGQFAASLVGISASVVWVAGMTTASLLVLGRLLEGNRVSGSQEDAGCDLAELGTPGYTSDKGVDVPELGRRPRPPELGLGGVPRRTGTMPSAR
jgi:Amt family ammonium transporter